MNLIRPAYLARRGCCSSEAFQQSFTQRILYRRTDMRSFYAAAVVFDYIRRHCFSEYVSLTALLRQNYFLVRTD